MKKKKELHIESVGVPKLDKLSKRDYDLFVSSLEFIVGEYYKELKSLS